MFFLELKVYVRISNHLMAYDLKKKELRSELEHCDNVSLNSWRFKSNTTIAHVSLSLKKYKHMLITHLCSRKIQL